MSSELQEVEAVKEIQELRAALHRVLRSHRRLLVAYSGGVDSAYLAWEARQVLGADMLAVLADSPSLARRDLDQAIAFADRHGIPLRIVETAEMSRPEYVRNDTSRCFHCKDELFQLMHNLSSEGGWTLAFGRNLDDSADFRPGQVAAVLHRVAAPLVQARLNKAQVRELARHAGLSLWDKPASACLASRIEYGRPVTLDALHQVEAAEFALLNLGFRQLRVRHHGALARIEIDRAELEQALSLTMLDRITAAVRDTGFTYVALDTQGYRSGSMNAVLPVESLIAASRRP